jgi:MFS family permease
MSAIVGTKQYLWYFDDPHGVTQGAIGSSLAAGSVVGALFAGHLSDRFGRRDTIAFSTSFWIVGTIVQVTTKGVGQLIAGRILNGVTVGITSSQVPVYLAEISKKNKRGQIVVIQQLAIEFGILVMFFIGGWVWVPDGAMLTSPGYACKFWGPDHSSHSFRLAWGIQLVPAVLLIAGAPFLPRSPRWLAKVRRKICAFRLTDDQQVGRDKEAIDILAKARKPSRCKFSLNKVDPSRRGYSGPARDRRVGGDCHCPRG